MAEDIKTEVSAVEAPAETVAATIEAEAKPKRARRTTAAKKAPVKKVAAKTTARKSATDKAEATKTTATKTRRTAAKAKPAAAKTRAKAKPETAKESAFELPRKAVLAGLGVYGKAFDEVQTRLKSLNEELEAQRGKASELYKELVARGEKVETEAKEKLADIDTSKFAIATLADREAIEARIEKAKGRFERLRKAAGLNKVA
ncbi:MAG: hypothetical protein ACPF9H_08830 [Aequoribacter sp.]|uniref:hypothetical protein n=1 Tax=Aequoribacter sp. TaxID=2847771 RepID=UPI003C6320EF